MKSTKNLYYLLMAIVYGGPFLILGFGKLYTEELYRYFYIPESVLIAALLLVFVNSVVCTVLGISVLRKRDKEYIEIIEGKRTNKDELRFESYQSFLTSALHHYVNNEYSKLIPENYDKNYNRDVLCKVEDKNLYIVIISNERTLTLDILREHSIYFDTLLSSIKKDIDISTFGRLTVNLSLIINVKTVTGGMFKFIQDEELKLFKKANTVHFALLSFENKEFYSSELFKNTKSAMHQKMMAEFSEILGVSE